MGHAEREERYAEAGAGTYAQHVGPASGLRKRVCICSPIGRERCARKERRHRFGEYGNSG